MTRYQLNGQGQSVNKLTRRNRDSRQSKVTPGRIERWIARGSAVRCSRCGCWRDEYRAQVHAEFKSQTLLVFFAICVIACRTCKSFLEKLADARLIIFRALCQPFPMELGCFHSHDRAVPANYVRKVCGKVNI